MNTISYRTPLDWDGPLSQKSCIKYTSDNRQCPTYHNVRIIINIPGGARGSVVVDALRYKPEDSRFEAQ
jgi:hypothetical protein